MENSVLQLTKKTGETVLTTEGLGKVYPNGTRALNDVSVTVKSDDFIVIIGSSGAGKSTFLRCLNRLLPPSEGKIVLGGEEITTAAGRRLRSVRRQVGMIFQQFHLIRRLSVLENVMVGRLRFCRSPLRYAGSLMRLFPRSEQEIAFDLLRQVGIEHLAYQRADSLSGGQQQRVAIARTLAQEPSIFLADEPIASLDPRSSETVMRLLAKIHEERGIPVIVNLHHIDFARRYGKRILGMADGNLVFDGTEAELSGEVIRTIYGGNPDEEYEVDACA